MTNCKQGGYNVLCEYCDAEVLEKAYLSIALANIPLTQHGLFKREELIAKGKEIYSSK